jgi:hypothetical protein
MKRLLLALSLFFAIPVSASEITSKIVDSVQLTVQGAAVQSTRIGASYGVSGTNIQSTSFGGTAGAGTYDVSIRQVKHSHSARASMLLIVL